MAERPRAVRKADLRTRLWPETYVSNTALAQLVTELRKAIGDEARQGRWIRTVFGFGYAFAGEAESETDAPRGPLPRRARPRPAGCSGGGRSCLWRRARTWWAAGTSAEVRIPASEVSRRHARIVVEAPPA